VIIGQESGYLGGERNVVRDVLIRLQEAVTEVM